MSAVELSGARGKAQVWMWGWMPGTLTCEHEARIIEVDKEVATRDSISAAVAACCSTVEIAKTMVFECEAESAYGRRRRTAFVVLSGERMADTIRLANVTSSVTARKLRSAEVLRLNAYSVGGFPPFPHEIGITLPGDVPYFVLNMSGPPPRLQMQ
jgi:prolyl-tRNA editing enzyme YbaK/EbsC (Cys-tRNA(Pro) deacylase)